MSKLFKKSKIFLGLLVVAVMFVGAAVVSQGPSSAEAADCSITSTLRLGSKGTQVACLQTLLGGLTADGSFGPKTKVAVMAYQAANGLVADGVVGALSRGVLMANTGGTPSCPPGSFDPMTGAPCPSTGGTLPAGCLPGYMYSPTTGALCTLGTTPPPASGTGLGVSLASSNPASATLPDGSAYNKVLALNLTGSTSGAVNVTGLRVTRSGFSLNSDFTGVLVMDANGARHGNVVTVSDSGAGDKAFIQFASDPIVVPANGSTTVWVLVNIDAAQTGNGTFAFSVNSAADVMTSGSVAVSGTFPVMGNVFSVINGATFLGALDIDASTISASARSVDLGSQDYIIGKFKFYETSSKEDIWIKSVRMFNNGNTTDADLADLKLVDDATGTVLATATGTTSKYVTFTLANPLKILKGQNKTLYVSADVVNGSSRTAQFIVQNDYDVSSTGVSTGGGVLATHSTNLSGDATSGFPVGDASNYNTISVTQGSLTVTKDNTSSSADLSQGQVGAVLGVWKLEATGEDVELQKADLSVTGTSTASDFSGSVSLVAVSASGAETTIYSNSTLTSFFDDDAAGTDQVTLSNYYVIPSNTSVRVKLVANLSTSATNALTTVGNLGDVYYRRVSTNNYATASDDAFVAANTRTISTATVVVAKNSSYGNQNMVAGGSEVKIGSYVIQAGSAEGVNVSSINVDMSAVTGWTNMKLKKVNADGTETTIGSTVTSPSTTDDANSFSVGGQLNVAASASVVVNVYANSSSTAVAVTTDIDASDVTASGLASGTSLSTIPSAQVTGQTITVQTGGTLLVETDTSSPVEAVLHSSESGRDLLKLKFTSQYEAIDISKLVFGTASGNANLSSLSLTAGSATFSTTPVNGTATFTGLTLQVPKDNTLTVMVRGTFTNSGTLVSAQNVRVGLDSMIATGLSSGARVYELSRTTTGSAGDIAADTATALTVGSTTGFGVGDVVQVNTAGGVSAFTGVVTAVGSATSLTVRGPQNLADCASATCYVTKYATREAVTSTSGGSEETITDATSSSITVSSTRGFAPGDIAFMSSASGTADDANFYTVVSVTDGDTMNIIGVGEVTASPNWGNASTADRLTRMATTTSTQTTDATDDLVANTAAAIDVLSSLGFAVGDIVVLNATTSAVTTQQLYVVTAVTSATSVTLKGKGAHTNIPANSWITELSTTLTTTVSTASTITADTVSAVTLSSTAGFAVGDVVYVSDDADTIGADLFSVTAVTSTTISVVGNTGIAASVGAYVTRLASSTANSKPYTVHDVEPVITLDASSPAGTTSGSSNQVVAIFDVKADGDVPLTIKALTLTRGGNIGTRVATSSTPKVYDYSSGSLGALLGTGATWSGTTAGSTSAITLDTPYDVSAGQTLRLAVTVNTASAAANDTFQVYVDNSSGIAGLYGGLSWYYVANSPSPGTEPTNASPATLSDTYPVYGNTLLY